MKKADVIIIGSGIAALQLARRLQDFLHVMIITKKNRFNSNSYMAQGGVAAAISSDDSIDLHVKDTIIAGNEHGNHSAIYGLVSDGKKVVQQLVHDGMNFDRKEDGSLSLGMEGAHSIQRILHAGGDQTGKHLIHFLMKTLTKVQFVENEMAFSVIKDKEDRCIGVKTKDAQNRVHHYLGSHVVIATGGIGGLYAASSNDSTVLGDGMAMAYLAGARLIDMEFIQFHPTLLYINRETKGLISEAVRGEGAHLMNHHGRRIMDGVHPQLELAPRHIVAQQIFLERQKGNEVFLDIRTIKDFQEKFPSITQLCQEHAISIEEGLLPVSPGCHFMMGGIAIDEVGQTNVKGLFAIGEAACTTVHGANRLASNSLLEGLVFGERLADYLKSVGKTHEVTSSYIETKKPQEVRRFPFRVEALKENMMNYVGIIRSEEKLQQHNHWLQELNQELIDTLDPFKQEDIQKYFMWLVGSLISKAALLRTESRGGHIRSDFPEEQQEWYQKRIIHECENNVMRVYFDEQNQIKIYA